MLPTQLLTPFQAERDHATRDMYTYATIQVGHTTGGGVDLDLTYTSLSPSLRPCSLPFLPLPRCPSPLRAPALAPSLSYHSVSWPIYCARLTYRLGSS